MHIPWGLVIMLALVGLAVGLPIYLHGRTKRQYPPAGQQWPGQPPPGYPPPGYPPQGYPPPGQPPMGGPGYPPGPSPLDMAGYPPPGPPPQYPPGYPPQPGHPPHGPR